MAVDDLLSEFKRAESGASNAAIAEAERRLGVPLPQDYLDFMRAGDGGEGLVGAEGYLRLWPIGELAETNAAYQTEEGFYPGWVLIGTNGGGEAAAFRWDAVGPEFTYVAFIGGEPLDRRYRTFDAFLHGVGSSENLEPSRRVSVLDINAVHLWRRTVGRLRA